MSNYSYEPHDWFNEELITEESMDYIENGIANAYSWLGELEEALNTAGTFFAFYNTTTYAEVQTAHEAGKAVFAVWGDIIAPLVEADYNYGVFIFSCVTRIGEIITITLENDPAPLWGNDSIEYVPTDRAINNKVLSSDITLTASDVGAAATNHNHDSTYAAINHNHNSVYAVINHNHDGTYSAINHNHDSTYTTPAQVDQKIADALANIPIADNIVYSAT